MSAIRSVEQVTTPREPASIPSPDVSEGPLPPGRSWVLPVILPVSLVVLLMAADLAEGPKTSFVGVIAVIPMLGAVFGTPLQTAITGGVALLAAFIFGTFASDGNAAAQWVRLGIIAVSAIGAVLAARARQRRDLQIAESERSRALAERLQIDATTDLLTGLLNRRGLVEALERLDRSAGPFTLAIADCDNFKQINDAFGHSVGDEYLKVTARRLGNALATDDTLGRWGGDEFLVVLPLGVERATGVLERVARQTAGSLPGMVDQTVSLTFGVAEWRPGESLDSVILRADRAMYSGKGTPNRVHADES